MIGYLEGKVKALRAGSCIILVGGIGYKVSATRATLSTLGAGNPAALWTHLVVREDAQDLYGFADEEDLRAFELLLTVSGIGPKSALSILDTASVGTLKTAVGTGNAEYLTNVAGIGKKTAEKIVLELRDKVGLPEGGAGESFKGDAEALEAMKSLGYSAGEARDALRKVPREITRTNDRLREALKMLGNGGLS